MSDAAKPLSEIGVLIKRLKDKMDDPAIYEQFASWGESAEEAMIKLADLNHGFEYYDCVMSDWMGVAQQVGRPESDQSRWGVVTKLTVSHEYYSATRDLAGRAERHCYLGFNMETGKIDAFFTEDEIENYIPNKEQSSDPAT